MPRFNIAPSPSEEVILTGYDGTTFPEFRKLFEAFPESPQLAFLCRPPHEASLSLVLENRATKAITALAYRWVSTDPRGEQHTRTCYSDSYQVDVYSPVVKPNSKQLVTPSGMLSETLIDHVVKGGGVMGTKSSPASLEDAVEVSFLIDLILFADGEICGPDPDRCARELRAQKPAAEFVAEHIRRARNENRNVEPVLSALAEIPCLGRLGPLGKNQGDPNVLWVRHYARDYLRHIRRNTAGIDWAEARLRHLETRPTLPKFYRARNPGQ